MNKENTNESVKLVQLNILNVRVNLYASKLWQVPFAYLAIVSLAIANSQDQNDKYLVVLSASLLFLGGLIAIVVVWWHNKRIDMLISKVGILEDSLNLEKTMKPQFVWHYYFLVAFCMGSIIYVAYINFA